MNISSSVENNPALVLLQRTIESVTLSSPPVQQVSDTVDISDAALQLAQTAGTADA